MSWIELHQTLPTSRKTIRFKNTLRINTPQAVGHICMLWLWAIDNAPDGDLSDFTPEEIAECAGWTGEGAESFTDALRAAGFLGGDMALNDWYDIVGRLMEHRAAQKESRERRSAMFGDMRLTRAVRSRDGDTCRFCGRTVNWKDRRGDAGGTYEKLDPEGGDIASNVVVSCRGCSAARAEKADAVTEADTQKTDGAQVPTVTPGAMQPARQEIPTEASADTAPELKQIYGRKKADPRQVQAENICHNGRNYLDSRQKKPVITVPDRTEPNLTVPDRTVPDRTVPNLTVPDRTVPDRTVPDRTVPDRTAPDRTALDRTVPGKTLPDRSLPGLAAPFGAAAGMTAPSVPLGAAFGDLSPPGEVFVFKALENAVTGLPGRRSSGGAYPRDKNAALIESMKKGAGV